MGLISQLGILGRRVTLRDEKSYDVARREMT